MIETDFRGQGGREREYLKLWPNHRRLAPSESPWDFFDPHTSIYYELKKTSVVEPRVLLDLKKWVDITQADVTLRIVVYEKSGRYSFHLDLPYDHVRSTIPRF